MYSGAGIFKGGVRVGTTVRQVNRSTKPQSSVGFPLLLPSCLVFILSHDSLSCPIKSKAQNSTSKFKNVFFKEMD